MVSEVASGVLAQTDKSAKRHLMSVSEARATMLAALRTLPEKEAPLDQSLGRVLVRPVRASRDQPPFAVSAMDGYAVRAADTPATLVLAGESAAGRGFAGTLVSGQAVRISTGAPLPDGADTIAIQEDVQRDGDRVSVPALKINLHIRPRGGDFENGAVLLDAGRRLDGVALALAAAAGAASLTVRPRPRIAILCSGDELVAPGQAPGPFQIFDSATHGVAALAEGWGGVARRLAIAHDNAAAIALAAEQGLREHDLLVVIGGASVGDHDHAKPALRTLGLEMLVDKVALRPGKPTWFGTTPLGPVLGLPGNPASALVCAHLFLKPLMERMLEQAGGVAFRAAHLAQALPANGAREHYLRARLDSDGEGRLTVQAFEQQDSSLLSVFVAANALIRLAPGAAALEAGALVDVFPLDMGC
jgi:molybdopterin molybdotransferase